MKDLSKIFPPATLSEIIEARKKYPFKTKEQIIRELANEDEN